MPSHRKPFNTVDDKHRRRCVYELVCRRYLDGINFERTTKFEAIEPNSLYEEWEKISPDAIRIDFYGVAEELENYILEKDINKVILTTEEGRSVSTDFKTLGRSNAKIEQKKELVMEIFDLLRILHDVGVVHRDIKPDNFVYVTRNGRDVLAFIDWDISFVLDTDNEHQAIKIDRIYCTKEYVAPEQVGVYTNSGPGYWTDVWQAGVICYRLYNNWRFPNVYPNPADYQKGERFIRDFIKKINYNTKNGLLILLNDNVDISVKHAIEGALIISPIERFSAQQVLDTASSTKENPKKTPEYPKDNPNHEDVSVGRYIAVVALVVLAVVMVKLMPDFTSRKSNYISSETTTTDDAVSVTSAVITEAPVVSSANITATDNRGSYYYENIEISGQGTYTGYVDDRGYPHGEGYFMYANGDVYDGNFKHGNFDGKGTMTYSNGDIYDGLWSDGVKNDEEADYTFAETGNIYHGNFKNNMIEGEGIFKGITADGYIGTYYGSFKNGKFEGKGTFEFENGDTFTGIFKDNDRWNGTFVFHDGSMQYIEDGKPRDE